MEHLQYLVAGKHRGRILQTNLKALGVWNRLERHLGGQAFEQGLLSIDLSLATATQPSVVMLRTVPFPAPDTLLFTMQIAVRK